MKKKSFETKDQLILGISVLGLVAFLQLNDTMKSHMQDCAEKSKTLARVMIGVATLVAGELILKALGMFHLATDAVKVAGG